MSGPDFDGIYESWYMRSPDSLDRNLIFHYKKSLQSGSLALLPSCVDD